MRNTANMANTAKTALALNLVSRLRQVPRKVWVMLALTLLVTIALAIWLAVVVISNAWNAGGDLLGRGQASVAAAIPNAQERLQALSPELSKTLQDGRETVAALTPEARRQLEAVAPELQATLARGRETLATVAPETAQRLEAGIPAILTVGTAAVAADVLGEDIAEIPRHAALARSAYALVDGKRDVTYAGSLPFAQALAWHRQPLIDAGFSERILQSSATATAAEYRRDARALAVTVTANNQSSSTVRIVER